MAETVAGTVPGKLMIAGEYAVLDGRHRALSVAVGRLVGWRLKTPESNPRIDVEAFDTTFSWVLGEKAPAGIASVVDDALRGAAGAGWPLTGSLRLKIAGQVDGVKFGLGTSAATVVATLRACRAGHVGSAAHDRTEAEAPEARALAGLAHAIHFAMQGGKGSGYDIGTIQAGGTVAYDASNRSAMPVSWPGELWALALFTGEAANTRTAIRKKPTGALRDGLGEASERLIDTWTTGDVASILRGLDRCQRAFDEAVQAGTMLPSKAVETTCGWIRERGGVARVSGAGGGDCVLAFGTGAALRDKLLTDWAARDGLCVHRLPEDIAPSTGAVRES